MSIVSNRIENSNPGNANNANQTANLPAGIRPVSSNDGTPHDDGHHGVADAVALPEIPDTGEIQPIITSLQRSPLAENHLADLHNSGLSDTTIRAAGLCSAPAAATRLLGFHDSPALVIPYTGHPGYVRIKPDEPRTDANGRQIKYESLRGSVNHLYIPSRTRTRLYGIGERVQSVIITEGEKKALKADQEGFAVISVPGVWGWRSIDALREIAAINWEDRQGVIAFDSDVTRKQDVKNAIAALVEHLKKLKAEVRIVLLPDIEGHEKTGLDDYLVVNGQEGLQALLANAGDWFSTLLALLDCGLEPEPLEAAVRPLYELIGEAGAVSQEELIKRLRNRLKELGYTAPPVAELKRHCRNTQRDRRKQSANGQAETEPVIRFVAEGPDGRFAGRCEKYGLYDMRTKEPTQLTNFIMRIAEDVHLVDDLRPRRRFRGTITLLGSESPFAIDAEDFASGNKLTETVFKAAGGKAEIHCKPEALRTAISAVSHIETRQASTNFGWNTDKTAYLVPSGQITANGFQVADASATQVDLADQEFAKRLNLQPIMAELLAVTKRHVVDDLLRLCPDLKVGYSLLAGAALSVLYRFTDGMNRPLLWIAGLSGNGKSHMAKLFQNFFGDFPIAGEKAVISWASTSKRIQHEGYYFRDALYLVDDYKPEYCQPREATWLLQAYADSSARSRLQRDATAAETREIRGLLVCTGEDVPDHSASATARLIKIPYPKGDKDLKRGQRCHQQRLNYAGVMTDFIRHVLVNNRGPAFVARVAELQTRFYDEDTGQDNDVRIAGNFAMLAAAFEEIADYLHDAWAGADAAKLAFVNEHVPELRRATLADVSDQKASQLFLSTLAGLVHQGAVRVQGLIAGNQVQTAAVVGRTVEPKVISQERPRTSGTPVVGRQGASPSREPTAVEIWTSAALGAVQQALRQQGKPPLAITEKAMLQQLREDGVLLDNNNQKLAAEGTEAVTRQVKVGEMNRRGFRILRDTLMKDWL